MTTKLAIFRIPSDDEEHLFVQLTVEEDQVDSEGPVFTVGPESSYNEMHFDHIVIADPIKGGSHDLVRYQIGGVIIDGGSPDESVRVYELEEAELKAIILHLVSITPDEARTVH